MSAPDYERLLLAYIRAPESGKAEARAALHAAGFPISKQEPPEQQEMEMHRDSLEWLETMRRHGPRDCREMFAQVAAELRVLRQVAEREPQRVAAE